MVFQWRAVVEARFTFFSEEVMALKFFCSPLKVLPGSPTPSCLGLKILKASRTRKAAGDSPPGLAGEWVYGASEAMTSMIKTPTSFRLKNLKCESHSKIQNRKQSQNSYKTNIKHPKKNVVLSFEETKRTIVVSQPCWDFARHAWRTWTSHLQREGLKPRRGAQDSGDGVFSLAPPGARLQVCTKLVSNLCFSSPEVDRKKTSLPLSCHIDRP